MRRIVLGQPGHRTHYSNVGGIDGWDPFSTDKPDYAAPLATVVAGAAARRHAARRALRSGAAHHHPHRRADQDLLSDHHLPRRRCARACSTRKASRRSSPSIAAARKASRRWRRAPPTCSPQLLVERRRAACKKGVQDQVSWPTARIGYYGWYLMVKPDSPIKQVVGARRQEGRHHRRPARRSDMLRALDHGRTARSTSRACRSAAAAGWCRTC